LGLDVFDVFALFKFKPVDFFDLHDPMNLAMFMNVTSNKA